MSTLTTIQSTDLITNSRADINGNFSALNADKMETSVLDTDTTLAANSDSKVPTQKAVKAYVDAGGNVNASETTKGIVEEATFAEVLAGTASGGTGARLFVNPSALPMPVINIYEYADSPATWTKPTSAKLVKVQLWGGGGSGGSNAGGAGGGGGGVYIEGTFLASALGSTETVTVGAGGAGVATGNTGNQGGNSSFGSFITAYGGGGGGHGAGSNDGTGGSGGSWDAVGANGSASTAAVPTDKYGLVGFFGYGQSNNGTPTAVDGIYSGGGGSGLTNPATDYPGDSIWGGGGGASSYSTSQSTSVFGGAGGIEGGAGSVPGGGGGGTDGGGTSGAGGNGRVIVTTFF